MNKSFNIVFRILSLVLLLVIVFATSYYYVVNTVNAFYKHDEGDVAFSSMDIIRIFSLDNGKTIVMGTFLPDDNVLNNTSVFLKAYDSNGKIIETASLEVPEGLDIENIVSNGENILIKYSKDIENVEHADFVVVNESLKVENSLSIENDYYSAVFSGFYNEDVFVGTVISGNLVIIKNFYGDVITEVEFSEDVSINDGYYVNGNFYLVGEVESSEKTSSYIVKLGLDGVVKNSWIMGDDFYFNINNVFSTVDDKIYIVGNYFNVDAYNGYLGSTGNNYISENAIKAIANQSISTIRSYFPILFTSDYGTDPWSSVFLCEITDDGNLSTFISPIDDSSSFGVSDIRVLNKTQEAGSLDNGNRTIAVISSKIASNKNSDKYNIYCYKLYNSFQLSDSVMVDIEASTDCYFGYDAYGRFYVYIGKTNKSGVVLHNLKFYDSFGDFEEEQRKLNLYTEYYDLFNEYVKSDVLGYVFVFLILYISVRFYGAEVKRTERKKRVC